MWRGLGLEDDREEISDNSIVGIACDSVDDVDTCDVATSSDC